MTGIVSEEAYTAHIPCCIHHLTYPEKEEHAKEGGRIEMARYPWMYFVNIVMKTKSFSIEENTYYDQYRRYRRIGKAVDHLHEEKKITTKSPALMNADDIRKIIEYRRSQISPKTGKPLSKDDAQKDECVLRALFNHPDVDNKNFDKCLAHHPGLKAVRSHNRLPPMEENDLRKLIKRANQVADDDTTDFETLRAYFVSVLAANTGARMIEIRNMKTEDVDVKALEIYLRVVKGMNKYGKPRLVPILPHAKKIVSAYLVRLESWKKANGLEENPYLFPSSYGDGMRPLTTKHIGRFRKAVEEDLGFEFDQRMCRRTFYQQLLDLGIDSDDGSVVMGNTVGVLEKHYGRRRPRMVIDKIKARFYE